MPNRILLLAIADCFAIMTCPVFSPVSLAQTRYATSDNMSGFVHWIDLYDSQNNRIDPNAENPPPYSPAKTCGRCHDFDTISHGWHFDAVDAQADHGRPGQPWIWSDARTGTHLPLSYRNWPGTLNPDALGLTRWQVAAKFGGFLPGGGPGSLASLSDEAILELTKTVAGDLAEDRSSITGELPIDCMLCHQNRGSGYSPFVWTEQIESQNFAYAPTAALGLGEVNGTMARLRNLDLNDPESADKLPKVTYDSDRFRKDGKVFVDLIRKPLNNSCYYCHTNRTADSFGGQRWLHDEDIHIQAGMACVDCHRNGLDHQIVRGFDGEQHPAGKLVATFSCQGCHLGTEDPATDLSALSLPGRLGAPKPEHRGLPPLHFEKMTCTACHSGPVPEKVVGRQINAIAHRLGEHVKRTGEEFPAIFGPVNLPMDFANSPADSMPSDSPDNRSAVDSARDALSLSSVLAAMTKQPADENSAELSKYTPQRLLWPSYWATRKGGKLTVLNPEIVFELIRRPLKVRRDFTEELAEVSLPLSQRKELLGDDRARVKDEERTPEERQIIADAENNARKQQITERIGEALAAIEKSYPDAQAIFVSGGSGYVRDEEAGVSEIPAIELGDGSKPYAWPQAHNVRPARLSWGVKGCTECHNDEALFFNAEIQPVGMLPNQEIQPVKVSTLQNIDTRRLRNWNLMFAGRDIFKLASLAALAATCLIVLSAFASNLVSWWRRSR